MTHVVWATCVARHCPSFQTCRLAYRGSDVPPGSYGMGWPYLAVDEEKCVAYQPRAVSG